MAATTPDPLVGGSSLQQLRHLCAEDVRIHGLGEEVVGSPVQGLHRCVDGPEAADHEDGHGEAPLPEDLHRGESVHARHAKVPKDQVEGPRRQELRRPGGVPRHGDVVAVLAQKLGGGEPERAVVVHHQDAPAGLRSHASSSPAAGSRWMGISTLKRAPPSERLDPSTRPP